MRAFTIYALERLCPLTHRWTGCKLAALSFRLEEKWNLIEADHKDTTEPQRKFVKQKCERCNMYALPGSNRCKYHTDPMSPTENIVTT